MLATSTWKRKFKTPIPLTSVQKKGKYSDGNLAKTYRTCRIKNDRILIKETEDLNRWRRRIMLLD